MMFNDVFNALAKEAQFTNEMLGAGATQIRKANYACKGIYFQSFTSLSTGLERIGKLCLMLDYYIDNSGAFPDFKYLKNDIGHDILKLYDKAIEIAYKRSTSFSFLSNLNGEIHQNILTVLSQFAEGDRYANINLLVNSKHQSDPVATWFSTVDMKLFEERVTKRKKDKIANSARLVNQLTGHFTLVRHSSETGSEITDVEEASFRTGLQQAVAPYRQLYVLQIIRFWVELVRDLQYAAMELGKQEIPFMTEIFASFYNKDSYIRTKKTWDTI